MQKPPFHADVADIAPSDAVLTAYDEQHIITYLRLLDADAKGADWREVARIVLHVDQEHEPDRARRAFESHLLRAKWIAEQVTGTCYGVVHRPKATLPISPQPMTSRYVPKRTYRAIMVGVGFYRRRT